MCCPLVAAQADGRVIMHKNIMTYGTFEAKLAERLEAFERELPAEIRLAYLPAYGVIKLRLTGKRGDDRVNGSRTDRGTGAKALWHHSRRDLR
ncbi:MAG: hypothetical protein MZV63_22395 [Marinilabiliales bacterium]|nr:hypothetical protein [Marinilabiliales bacterium]